MLRALGLSGPDLQTPCTELLRVLYEEDAALYCFSQTFDELQRVLDFAARNVRRPLAERLQIGESVDFFVRAGFTASDLELAIAGLEHSLGALHIYVKDKPAHKASLGIDELRLKDVLLRAIKYWTEEAMYHDLDVVTRSHSPPPLGKPQDRLESCEAVFVTTNAALSRASSRFFREEFGPGVRTVPYCLLDNTLTTLVWLKRPLAAPNLPEKMVIADCYAALNPPETLWRSYVLELDRLQAQGSITPDDDDLLRYSSEARIALLDLTLGDANAFAEGTVEEVLERARITARRDLTLELTSEKAKRLEAERRAVVLQDRENFSRKIQLDHFAFIGTKIGKAASKLLAVAGVLLILLGIYATFPTPFPSLPDAWTKFLAPAAILIVGVLTFLHLVYGTTLRHLLRRLEMTVSQVATRVVTRLMLPKAQLPRKRGDLSLFK